MDEIQESPRTQAASLVSRLEPFFDSYHLTPLQRAAAQKYIKDVIADPRHPDGLRVRNWLKSQLCHRKVAPMSPFQSGCSDLVPGLRALGWWERTDLPWLDRLEARVADIREELLALRETGGFQPYRSPSWTAGVPTHDSGDWNVYYLFLHGMSFEDNCVKCPRTVEAVRSLVPRHFEHAFFSAINPGTHILPHQGATNKKLRLQLPVLGTDGTRFRVGDQIQAFEEGKARVFDDSFEHESWHDGSATRIHLIVDFWHPDLSDTEVKFLSFIQRAKMRAEQQIARTTDDSYFSVVQKARKVRPKDSSWWYLESAPRADANSP